MKNTDIYIYTLQGLRYPMDVLQSLPYIPGAFWTIQHFNENIF